MSKIFSFIRSTPKEHAEGKITIDFGFEGARRLLDAAPDMRAFVEDEALATILTYAHEVAAANGGPAIEHHCKRLLDQRQAILDILNGAVQP